MRICRRLVNSGGVHFWGGCYTRRDPDFLRRAQMQDEIVIRAAVPEDAASIATVHEAAINGERGGGNYDDEQLNAWAHRHTVAEIRARIAIRTFFIAESPIEPVAYGQVDVAEAVMRSVYVSPRYSRRGVGRRLVQVMFKVAEDAGLRRLELDSSLNAVPFYEALGFTRLGSLDHHLTGGAAMACVRMARDFLDEPTARR